VVVSGPVVTVGQVAEISENDSYRQMQLAQVELGPAPDPTQSRWYDLVEIKDALERNGVRLDQIIFSGARRVEVRPAPAETARIVVKKSREYWRGELERLVRENLDSEATPSENGEIFASSGPVEGIGIRVEGDRLLEVLTEQGSENWRMVLPEQWQRGWQQARVDLPAGDKTLRYPVMIHLNPAKQVVVPRIPLERGAKIAEEDLMLVAYEKEASHQEWVMDLSGAIGQEARRDLPAGEPIHVRDLRPTPIVFRGQPVTVHIRYGTAWLQKTFLAGSDGGAGEWIEVYDAAGRSSQPHPYQVRVVASHTAELPPEAPPSRASARAPSAPRRSNQKPMPGMSPSRRPGS
jgi:flagella basal body P-ring formation protein FlgA